jgi:hypothetical protein
MRGNGRPPCGCQRIIAVALPGTLRDAMPVTVLMAMNGRRSEAMRSQCFTAAGQAIGMSAKIGKEAKGDQLSLFLGYPTRALLRLGIPALTRATSMVTWPIIQPVMSRVSG